MYKNMAFKTALACCLMLSNLIIVEMAKESQKTCDARVDVTYLIDISQDWNSNDFKYEKEFLQSQIRLLLPSPNDVRIRIMLYSSEIYPMEGSGYIDQQTREFLYACVSLQYKNMLEFGSYMDKNWLMNIAQQVHQQGRGDNVIQGILEAARSGPESGCRKKHGARRVVVVVADAVASNSPDTSVVSSTLKARGVEVIALISGNETSSRQFKNYLYRHGYAFNMDEARTLTDVRLHAMLVNDLCRETDEMRLYREKMSASFQKKYTYRKHTYYLSKEYFDNMRQADDTCRLADGYLAVINDQQEYDAMKQYFTDNNPGLGFIIDGTDAGTEGKWTLLSGEPLPFVDWLPNNPGQESDDCLGVDVGSFKMFDTLCDGLPDRFPYFFLCEVSEVSEQLYLDTPYVVPDTDLDLCIKPINYWRFLNKY